MSFVRQYRGRLILDATGVGDPIYDDLKRVYSDVEGFKLTSGSKTELIQRLIVAVEQRRVSWPGAARAEVGGRKAEVSKRRTSDRINKIDRMGAWDVLTNEMKRYEYEISAAGHISYNAPAGYHDDCVIALALANHRRWETEDVGRMLPVGGAGRRGGVSRRRCGVLVG